MIQALISFELRRRLKMLSTYVYALVLFVAGAFIMMAAAGVFKDISAGTGSERIHANAPVSVHGNLVAISLLGLFTVAAIFGQAGTQDFVFGTWSIIFTRKLKKSTYLLGRFLGALLVAAALYLAVPVGLFFGALVAQVVSPEHLGPHQLTSYLWPYLTFVLPMLFVAGATFFSLAALSRQMAPVYVGVVVLVMGYLVLSSALADVSYKELAAVADPFGFAAFDLATRYWTPAERNTQLVPLAGWLLVNRLVWVGLASALLLITTRLFRTSVEEQKGKGQPRDQDDELGAPRPLPTTTPTPTLGGWLRTSLQGGWLLFREATRSPLYWSFLVAGLAFVGMALFFASRDLFGTPTLPVTAHVLELSRGSFGLFTLIITTFYAGELVWRERDAGMADIVFATRAPGWVTFVSKVLALVLLSSSVQVVAGVAAFFAQVVQGYTYFEPRLYFTELVVFGALKDLALCALAVAVQVAVNHKYLGHGVMVGYFVLNLVLQALGVEDRLVRYGSEPRIDYSDMNGYGHWVGAALTWRALWYGVGLLLLLGAAIFSVRSRETGARARLALARQRLSPAYLGVVAAVGLAVVGLGGFLFTQTHLAHPYRTAKDKEREQAAFEKDYKAAWGRRAQPKIISATVDFDLFPEAPVPRLDAKGTLVLENKASEPIAEVMVNLTGAAEARVSAGAAQGPAGIAASPSALRIGGQGPTKVDEKLGVYLFTLSPALAPGAQVPLTFDLAYVSYPFKHGDRLTEVVGNGTFLNNFLLPVIGYDASAELSEDGKRKDYGLPPKERMAARDDPAALAENYIRKDADFMTLTANVSTVPDQVAVVPGALQREWLEGGRRHFTYVMDQPILNFYSVLSGRYEVRRDDWKGVKLEIYHHPTHTADLDQMMAGMKAALEYCTTSFGPYQHTQARILEFPRYAKFAQSFPNTIPFSEAVGFIAKVRPDDPDDLDYPYYVTAHEIAHQWWGHQAVGANVRGATMTSETLAQYTALMVMKHAYGEARMRRFLKYELDHYLTGRVFERKKELPLALNENQPYVHYQKGSLAMYALQHFIGEDAVNRALKAFLEGVRLKGPPYATSTQLVAALREVTPPERASLIDDLFESITLYDNRALSATARPNPDGTWAVTVKVKAVKYRADEAGAQTELDFSDLMDVGGLDEKGEALCLEARTVSKGEHELTFTCAKKPAKVGVDPLNMLIDRTSDDNVTAPSYEAAAPAQAAIPTR